jgi:hypothetical protein
MVTFLCHVSWLLNDITGVYWHIGIGQTPQAQVKKCCLNAVARD